MAFIGDANVLAILKAWYDQQGVENLLFRNSPTLKQIAKQKFGGKYYPLPMMYSRSGAVSGDYNKALAAIADGPRNVEMQITAAQMFSVFQITPKEYLASKEYKGAYMTVLAEKAFAANENLRKILASCLFGTGCGELGKVTANVANAATTANVDARAAVTLDLGTQLYFIDSNNPYSGNAISSTANGYHTVTAVATNEDGSATITFTPAFVSNTNCATGDYVMLYGGRDDTKAPLLPTGLAGWIPTDRSNLAAPVFANFFNVNRAAYPSRLAGSVITQSAANKKKEAVTNAVRAVRRQGGVPNAIVGNDLDLVAIMAEIQASQNYWQATDGSSKGTKNAATVGFEKLKWSFSTSWLEYMYDDPYCPKGVAYVLDLDSIKFIALTETSNLDDGVSDNQPGAPETSAQSEPSTQYQFLVDDMYTTQPINTTDGPGLAVIFQLFGQFIISNPAHVAAVVFID